MARIKGNGVPTRKTKGALGDIYTDVETGKLYECVFAHRIGTENMFDCQWKEIAEEKTSQTVVKAEEPKQEDKTEPVAEEAKTDVKAEPEIEKIPVEESEETKSEEAPKRTNYTAYSKNGKK